MIEDSSSRGLLRPKGSLGSVSTLVEHRVKETYISSVETTRVRSKQMAYHRSSATGSCDSTNPVVTGRPSRKYCNEDADLLKMSIIRLVDHTMRDIPLLRYFY